jgi:hypothetical protein
MKVLPTDNSTFSSTTSSSGGGGGSSKMPNIKVAPTPIPIKSNSDKPAIKISFFLPPFFSASPSPSSFSAPSSPSSLSVDQDGF